MGPLLVFGAVIVAALCFWLWRAPETRQSTCCWCPGCENELVACERTTHTDDGSVVTYSCGSCSHVSRWLFDAPVPILL